jgi:molecular chaperone GrpE
LRAVVEASEARDRASQSALAEQITTATTAIRADVARTNGALVDQLAGLGRDVGKLSREQFQATSLLEGQGTTLDELAGGWREHLGQRDREIAHLRQALTEREVQLRLGFITQLLPVADAVAESIHSARDLVQASRARPHVEAPHNVSPFVARLRRILAPPLPSAAAPEAGALESWLHGLMLVERRLLAFLEREDVRPIPSVGQVFDPHRHLAVAVAGDGNAAEGTVVSEERRGYVLGDRVLRPAEVVVARQENSGSRDGEP